MPHKAGKDSIAFRRAHLDKTPRLQAALDLVREKSRWGTPLPERVGRGVSVQPSFRSFIATVVEAEVDERGKVDLRRVTSAIDTGISVNPDTIMAQLQGGLIFGLTAALYGEVTVDRGGSNDPISTTTACCASIRSRTSKCTSSRVASNRAASARPG